MSSSLATTFTAKIKQARQLLFCDRTAKQFKHAQDYFTPQPIAGYIGFLGHHNLGDEVLFEAFKALFPQFQLLAYDGAVDSVHNPPFSYYPIELAIYRQVVKAKDFYNAVFLGGGTLINRQQYLSRFQHALQHGHVGLVFGTGVAEPQFWHQYGHSEDFLHQIKQWIPVLKEAASVTVRGPRSAATLAEYGLETPDVIGDPALSLCLPRPLPHRRTGTVGISVGCHGTLWGDQPAVNAAVAALVEHLLANDLRVELLPFDPGDQAFSQQIVQHFNSPRVSMWPHTYQIERTLLRLRTYDWLIGQRLHAMVLACGCGVPFIGLKYAPKCDDFLDSIDGQDWAIRTDQLTVDELIRLADQIEHQYDSYCQQLTAISNHYRMRQRQAAQAVLDLVK